MKKTIIAALLSAAFLGACGGGGGGGNDNTAQNPVVTAPTTLSGTAAAGAALVGSVTVKDATGKTKTVPIGAGGGYEVDVSDMTAPFMLRASGQVGGRSYVLHSVATDTTKTVNVTPFTDLIVANVAGQLASAFFDNPDNQKLSPASIAQQQAALKQRLQTVLTALGVDAAVDLLHTQFTADHTKLDAALDVLRVSVDEATNVATIRNLITQEAIEDNLASTTDSTALTDTTNVAEGVSDLQAIVATMKAFTEKFATGLPNESDLLPLVHAEFLHHDEDRAQFIGAVTGEPINIGIQFTNVMLQDISGDTATISFDVVTKDGLSEGAEQSFKMKKVNGKWLLFGNQYAIAVENYAMTFRTYAEPHDPQVVQPRITTVLEFWMEDRDSSNSPNVSYAIVKGPGLPASGIRFDKRVGGGSWSTVYKLDGHDQQTSFYHMPSDTAIKSIPNNAEYQVKIYNTDNTEFATYKRVFPKRPYTNEEAAGLQYTAINPSIVSAFATFTGGNITISGTTPAGVKRILTRVELDGEQVETDAAASNGAFGPVTLTMPTVESPFRRTIRSSYMDDSYREIFTVYHRFAIVN